MKHNTTETIIITIKADAPNLSIHVQHEQFSLTITNQDKPLRKLHQILYDFLVTHATAKANAQKLSPTKIIHQTIRERTRPDRYSLRKMLKERKK